MANKNKPPLRTIKSPPKQGNINRELIKKVVLKVANKNKQKGSRFEAEIVKKAQDAGLYAMRCWGSNGRASGFTEDVDGLIGDYKYQAKVRKKLPNFCAIPPGADITVFKEDRGTLYCMIPFGMFLDLVKQIK